MLVISKVKIISHYIFFIFFFIISLIAFSCTEKSPTDIDPPEQTEPKLELISSFNLQVDEPSGLCFSLDMESLWTVSDNTRKVYKIDLTGKTQKTLSYTGNDLEGVAINPKDSTIWVAEENLSQIVQLDTLGNELNRITVTGAGGGSGLEGITINSANNHFILLKEKNPGVLIELDEEFNLLEYKRISFANDYSGIFYESQNQHLWIVSDQNEKVYKCDMEGVVLIEYPIDVDKAEGIAVDINNDLVYVVSDDTEKLYVFEIIDI
ncbi:MAG: SdiA-regulated domain-containing protein [Bacteroidota bacterium]